MFFMRFECRDEDSRIRTHYKIYTIKIHNIKCMAELKNLKHIRRSLRLQGTNAPPYISNHPHRGPPHSCKMVEAAKILYFKFRKPF